MPARTESGQGLVLFGAGASVDAAGPGLPPVTAGLVDELVRFDPSSWGRLPAERLDAFRKDFESAMADVLNRAGGTGPTFKMTFPLEGEALLWSDLQWALAAYFFGFEIVSDSLYERLIARIQKAGAVDRISIATLNYERLLCSAANRLGLFVQLGADVHRDRLRVCLPHGASYVASSADVANEASGLVLRPGPGRSMELVGLGPVPQLEARKIVVLSTQADFDAKRNASSAYPPIMCYIEPAKFTASGGSFIRGQRAIFSSWVAEAERIALIGLSVRPEDRHIWDRLARTPGEILYVSPSAANFEEWSRSMGRNDPKPIPEKWRDSFDEVCAFLRL